MTFKHSTLGYLPHHSFIHRLNPLTKFITLISVAILTITLVSDFAAIAILLFICLAYIGAGISLGYIIRRLRRLLTFIFFIALIQLLFTPYGTLLFYLIPPLPSGFGPFFPITTLGVANALVLIFRLINIVLISALFVATTDPTLFAASLTHLGIPYRYAFLLVLALRLVPLFDEEANIVRNAQRTRGIPVDKGLLRRFFRRLRYTFFPLIVSALYRVDSLTLAMDGRGFGYSNKRTYLRQPRFQAKDIVLTLTVLAVTIALIGIFTFFTPLPHFFG